jgi:hypothetical protein
MEEVGGEHWRLGLWVALAVVDHSMIDDGTGADESLSVNEKFAPPAAKGPTSQKRAFSPGEFIGSTFHRYKVLSLVAETPGGIVFRAESLSHAAPLALKMFKPSMLKTSTDEQNFTRAVKTMFGQRHPHVVELLDAGMAGSLLRPNLSMGFQQLISFARSESSACYQPTEF